LAKNDKNDSTLSSYTDCWHVCLSGGLNVGFNVTNMESKPRRTRKPDWTDEQCLLLVQLGDEQKAILKKKKNLGRVSIYNVLLTHCHPLSATHFFSLFSFLPFSPLLKKLLSLLKVLVHTPNNFDLKTSFKGLDTL